MKSSKIIVLGDIFNPISDTKCEMIKNGALVLCEKRGKYIIDKKGKANKILREVKDYSTQILDYSGKVIIPSFFDMHFQLQSFCIVWIHTI